MAFPCPHCQVMINVVEPTLGSDVQCPQCGSRISSEMLATIVKPQPEEPANANRDTGLQPATPSQKHPAGQVENLRDGTPSQPKEVFGRFQLLQRLGGGNFGEVFRAYDPSLDRVVALKRPHRRTPPRNEKEANRLAEEARRFKIEAQAAAQLKHPHIVGVYEVGEVEGRPFFTAEYVRGIDLAKLITGEKDAGRLLPVRQVAQLCGQVADALHAAHQAGVVHRDLKPANILVGEDGLPRVMDFGMAKRESAAEFVVTQAGTVLGSPAYMSPEQWQDSSSVGRATDIWSLGVMLFELLTGEFPFRASHDFERLKDQVLHDDPPLPSKLNSQVPADLDTLCQKCLEKDPSRRFPTAAALAQELHRFLHGEPIHSRPITQWERARKWCQRNPIIALLTAGIAVSLIAGTVISTIFAFGEAKEARESKRQEGIAKNNETKAIISKKMAEKAQQEEEKQRALADANATVAREQSLLALNTLTSIIFDLQRAFLNVPGGAAVRQRLLTTALEKLDQVSTEFADESAIDRNTRVALEELADTILQLGSSEPNGWPLVPVPSKNPNPPDSDPGAGNSDNPPTDHSAIILAERFYRRAFDISQQLAAANPNDTETQRDLSHSFNKLGGVYLKLGRTDGALTQFQEGLKINRALAEADPDDAEIQRDLAVSLNRLGDVFRALGRTDEALTQYEALLKFSRVQAEADPDDAEKQRDLSISLERLGVMFLTLGRTDDALAKFQDGLKISRVLAEADPNDVRGQRGLSISFSRLGDVFFMLGRTDEALTHYEASLKINRVQAEADPNDAEKQRDLSISFFKLGDKFQKLGRTDDALKYFHLKFEISKALAEADPNDAQRQRGLSISFAKLGEVSRKLGRTDDALVQFEAALKIDRALAETDPNDSENQRYLAISFGQLGAVFLTLGRTDDALAKFQDGLKISRVLAEAEPNDARKQRDLSISFDSVGDAFMKLGRTDDALTQFHNGLKIRRVLAETDPNNAENQRGLVISHYKLGEVHTQATQFDQAHEQFAQGIAVLDEMIVKGQLTEGSKAQRVRLHQRIQFCTDAKLATSDWDMLLKVDAKALPRLLILRATEMLNRGELANAVQAGDKLHEFEPKDKNNLYNAARLYVRCAELVTKDKPAPTDAEQVERQKFLNLALDCLKESLAAGWDDFAHMRKDDDLKLLRSLPKFEALFPKKM